MLSVKSAIACFRLFLYMYAAPRPTQGEPSRGLRRIDSEKSAMALS